MHEKLNFSKCEFCGRPMPSRRIKAKQVDGKTMYFCTDDCFKIYLKYDDIVKFKEKIPADQEFLD